MSLSVRVDCGDTVFKENFERWLAAEGLELCNDGKFHLLVDRPLGWAVLEHPDVDYTCCVTLSDNLCPSYQLDLLARNPAALIRLAAGDALLPALKSVSTGSVLHPAVATPLTAAERKTLRLVAFGVHQQANRSEAGRHRPDGQKQPQRDLQKAQPAFSCPRHPLLPGQLALDSRLGETAVPAVNTVLWDPAGGYFRNLYRGSGDD